MTTTTAERRLPAVVLTLVGMSLVLCLVQVVGTAAGIGWAGRAQWFAMPVLAVALVAADGLREARGRWWLAGLALSWVGDAFGGGRFLLLLGGFLLAHVCYLVALWRTRRHSWLGRAGSIPYLVLGAAGAAVIAPSAGPVLAGPVVAYAAALTAMAVLATGAGRLGAIGGLLFMVSDLTLGIGMFVVDIPSALRTALVMGTYIPAQAILLVAVLRLIRSTAGASRRSLA